MSASARDTVAKWLWENRLTDMSLLSPNNKWEFIGPDRQSAPLRDADAILAALSAAGLEVVRAHKWFLPPGIEYECCKDCGIVRRGDNRHRPCVGPVRVGLRHHEPLKDEYTEGAAMVSAEGKQ